MTETRLLFRWGLINTDWTVPGNEKVCRIARGTEAPVPVVVHEGAVTDVMLA